MSDFEMRLAKKRTRMTLGLESIDFQTDNFGSQLEAVFYDIDKFISDRKGRHPDAIRVELSKSEFPKILSETIFKRLGIRTNVIFNTTSFGMVMPFFMNEHHILLDKHWRGKIAQELPDQKKLMKQMDGQKGTIDTHNARVGGIFSQYQHDLWLDVVGHFTEYGTEYPEITAILLHELGHAFTYYELANRLEETNQVMAHLSRELRGKNDVNEKKIIFRELASSFGVKEEELTDLIEESNQTILGLKLFKYYVKMVKSQMPNSKYNQTASEQVADNFAARFGYGRHLITVLNNIHVKYGAPETDESNATLATIVELLFFHLSTVAAILSTLIIGMTPAAIIMPLLWILIFANSGDDSADMTYDALKIRYKRIRQQNIEMIQKLDLDKEKLRRVVDDIHFIDDIINNTQIYRSLFARLANFVFSASKEAKKDIELQYLLEELVHSDLFLKSAELSVLS